MNFYLKIFLVLAISTVVIFTSNFIILWLLLVLLTCSNWKDHLSPLKVFDIVLIFLLAIAKDIDLILIFFKVLYIINLVLTFIFTLSRLDKLYLKSKFVRTNTRGLKKQFYNKNRKKAVEYVNSEKDRLYTKDVPIDDKVNLVLARRYNESKIRFNELVARELKNVRLNWTRIDSYILLLAFILLVMYIVFGDML
jgi:hypothetical protein